MPTAPLPFAPISVFCRCDSLLINVKTKLLLLLILPLLLLLLLLLLLIAVLAATAAVVLFHSVLPATAGSGAVFVQKTVCTRAVEILVVFTSR